MPCPPKMFEATTREEINAIDRLKHNEHYSMSISKSANKTKWLQYAINLKLYLDSSKAGNRIDLDKMWNYFNSVRYIMQNLSRIETTAKKTYLLYPVQRDYFTLVYELVQIAASQRFEPLTNYEFSQLFVIGYGYVADYDLYCYTHNTLFGETG